MDVSLSRELHSEWDRGKVLSNERKHGVAFTLALTIATQRNVGSPSRVVVP